jgi:hypothetical protein
MYLTTYLHLVPRSRLVELYLNSIFIVLRGMIYWQAQLYIFLSFYRYDDIFIMQRALKDELRNIAEFPEHIDTYLRVTNGPMPWTTNEVSEQ